MRTECFLQQLVGRTERLDAIARYSLYDLVYYRCSVGLHTRQVAALVKEVEPLMTERFGPAYCPKTAELLAHIHDDKEICPALGDVQAADKALMTADQKEALAKLERDALEHVYGLFAPQLTPELREVYGNLLLVAHEYYGLEMQLVNYLDKFSAYCEALYELYAGNQTIAQPVERAGGRAPVPFEFYAKKLRSIQCSTTLLDKCFEAPTLPCFRLPGVINYQAIVEEYRGCAWSFERVLQPTGNQHLDFWLTALFRGLNVQDFNRLLVQTEFP